MFPIEFLCFNWELMNYTIHCMRSHCLNGFMRWFLLFTATYIQFKCSKYYIHIYIALISWLTNMVQGNTMNLCDYGNICYIIFGFSHLCITVFFFFFSLLFSYLSPSTMERIHIQTILANKQRKNCANIQ